MFNRRPTCTHTGRFVPGCPSCDAAQDETRLKRKELREKAGPFARIDVWGVRSRPWWWRLRDWTKSRWRKLLRKLGILPTYEIPFKTITSDRFEKSEESIKAYRYPVSKVLEMNSMRALDELAALDLPPPERIIEDQSVGDIEKYGEAVVPIGKPELRVVRGTEPFEAVKKVRRVINRRTPPEDDNDDGPGAA